MPRPQVSRDELMLRLQKHASPPDKTIELLKYFCIASHYLSLENHTGGAIRPGEKHYFPDGTQVTFDDVPIEKILTSIESYIKRDVPQEVRTRVFRAVMAGVRGYANKTPEWDQTPINPNEKPMTHLSESKAKPGTEKTNAQLVADLVSVADMDDHLGKAVACQITWKDAMGDDERCVFMNLGKCEVRGGRLGRDHTLEDVPNHFVRDQLMDYINVQLPEAQREAARKAVFSDLDAAELREYTKLIEQWRIDQERTPALRPTTVVKGRQNGFVDAQQRFIRDARSAAYYEQVSRSIERQDNALANIDETLDLTPQPKFVTRHYYRPGPKWEKSVIQPDSPALTKEGEISIGADLDRDCDQVRTMIKRFTKDGDWTIDQFRRTLGLSRPALTHFLEQSGPREGRRCNAYELGWEFFKRRELLGLPMTATPKQAVRVLRELNVNHGPKRKAAGAKGRPAKAPKVVGSRC